MLKIRLKSFANSSNKSQNQTKGIYLVYCANDIRYPETVKENIVNINDVEISTFLIGYDETKW